MDISFIIKKTTAYSLVTASITAAYVILILFIERFFRVTLGYQYLFTAIIAALFIVVTFEPLRSRLQAVVDRIFFRKAYEYQKVIKEVTKLVSSVIDLRTLFRLIDRTIVRVMCIKTAAVLLLEERESHYIVEKTNGLPYTVMGIKIALDNPLILFLKEFRDAAVVDELRAKLDSGSVEDNEKERLKQVVFEMEKLNAIIVIPSFLKQQLVGILALGEKLSGELYSPDDIELLLTLAQEAAIAIENAKLYRDISETRDYLNNLVEGSDDAIITLDLLGTVLTWNQGAGKIFGYERDEVAGRHPPFFGEDEVKTFVDAVISKKEVKSVRLVKKSRDGKEIPLIMTLSPIENSEGHTIAFSCILKDITELEKVESMKNEFFSVVSHELRTPLTPLLDYIELFREGMLGDLSDKQKLVLEKLRNLGRRELNLVNSILDFSRLERGSFKILRTPVNIKVFVKEIIDSLSPAASARSQTIEEDISDKMPVIMVEENLVSRLLAQIFDNAIKFTPRGGTIQCKAFPRPGGVDIEISDNGIGVAADKLEKIFDKFYQVDSSHTREVGGMGLGLAICKQIVLAHGGTIHAESKGVGKGLTIKVFLPLE
ncbi:MAG: PAS domain S-box protein [Candidatus Margulisbacteria bacterium]|nr:PAS domain S-box protein [Candidatus Margulisiibacteriota bacterium]